MSELNQAVALVVATSLFTQAFHFKRWAKDSKGHKDLLALVAAGSIADFDKEVELVKDEEGLEGFKRKSLSFSISTLDCVKALAGSGLSVAQVEHMQELVNGAIKRDIQLMLVDTSRTKPLTDIDLPTAETVLAQSFNKRPVAVKVTMEMINAAVAPLVEWLKAAGTKQGGIDLTSGLCTKKFSIAALNGIETPIIERVQGLVFGWFEALPEGEQMVHFPVVNLWTANIDAKLNPKQENISIDMF